MRRRWRLLVFIIFFTWLQAMPGSAASSIAPLTAAQVKKMIQAGVFQDFATAPVKPERLRRVTFSYLDFDGIEQEGQLVVFDVIAEAVAGLMQELFVLRFPVARCQPIEMYQADDLKSMQDNNSSCFNSRHLTGNPDLYSIHAYGLAIDINPRQNPYLAVDLEAALRLKIFPDTDSFAYVNRSVQRPGMVEPVVAVFKKYGFTVWGGDWTDRRIDYHHFQVPEELAKQLISLSYEVGKALFDSHLAAL